jgi:hypothetical protein
MRRLRYQHVGNQFSKILMEETPMCTEAPDTSGMNRAAEANAKIGQQALDWYKQIYNDSAPDRARASTAALEQSQAQTDLARFSLDRSQQEANRYDTTFKPIEAKIAADAMAYDTPQRREDAARQAVADTDIALSRAGTPAAARWSAAASCRDPAHRWRWKARRTWARPSCRRCRQHRPRARGDGGRSQDDGRRRPRPRRGEQPGHAGADRPAGRQLRCGRTPPCP